MLHSRLCGSRTMWAQRLLRVSKTSRCNHIAQLHIVNHVCAVIAQCEHGCSCGYPTVFCSHIYVNTRMCGYRTMWTCQPMQESQRLSCTVVQLLHAGAIPSSYRTHWTLSEFISSFVCSSLASPRAQALLFRTLLPNEIYRVIKSYEQFRKFLATFTYVRLSHNVKGFSCSVVQLLHARAIISHSYTS